MIWREVTGRLVARLREPRRFLQVLAGPRQVGKTTSALQAAGRWEGPHHYASADTPGLRADGWIAEQWKAARLLASDARPALLVLDEVQKLPTWSESVKSLWDEDTRKGLDLRVVLLGSAPLLVQRGLTESLAGRFEVLRATHWSLSEMRAAFGWDLERFLFFGGYPGAAALAAEERRWAEYVRDALIETTVSRDVLLLSRVDKPALLRQLFALACAYSAQVLSYQKMVGQLQEAGNNTTLAHYLDLLGGAGLVVGLQKFALQPVRARTSSPKLLALNTALQTAQSGRGFDELRADAPAWGRLVESAVGAHLVNSSAGQAIDVLYWRERDLEVDYVLRRGTALCAIEVKSTARTGTRSGLDVFRRRFPGARVLTVGGDGVALEELLLSPAERWLE